MASPQSKLNDELAHSALLDAKGEFGLNLNSEAQLEWLKDAGFGLFIHWSVDVQLGCVISHNLVGTSKDYQDRYFNELPKTFNPKQFDAEHIASLAKLMGVEYVVLTAKHHNGFCMWDTSTTDFSIMNTPYKRDIVKEFVDAVRGQGLKVGLYYSPEDFHFLYENDQPIQRGDRAPCPDIVQYKYNNLIKAQLTELCTRYGKLDMFFFDGDFGELAKQTVWELQPQLLITRGAIPTPEQRLPDEPSNVVFEANLTMGTAWQFQPTNEDYKSGTECINLLVEARAKGGVLLLNIGPDSLGRVPDMQENIMREIGMWCFVNKEAIHNVRAMNPIREGNIWFTRSKDGRTVYCILPADATFKRGERREFKLKRLRATDKTSIRVLGITGERTEYAEGKVDVMPRFSQDGDTLTLSVANAQRIYCNGSKTWPNPLVVALTDVDVVPY